MLICMQSGELRPDHKWSLEISEDMHANADTQRCPLTLRLHADTKRDRAAGGCVQPLLQEETMGFWATADWSELVNWVGSPPLL